MSKKLNEKNFLEFDDRMIGQSVLGIGQYMHPAETWVKFFTDLELAEHVPEEVREMFDRARGAMCYGVYYYPLFTLGMEESFRFMESALFHAFASLSGDTGRKRKKFAELISWAGDSGLISEADCVRWNACRHLRNSASHKIKESVYSPTMALDHLVTSKKLLESLFTCVESKMTR